MIQRALMTWFGILILANINGAVREVWLIPALGPTPRQGVEHNHPFCAGVPGELADCHLDRSAHTRDALLVGVLWLVLTLAFEFLVGHYVFHKPWAELTEDYHVLRGRIWPLVLLVVLFAPLWAGRLRRLW